MTAAEEYQIDANIEQEFKITQFGDQRRNQRSRFLFQSLVEHPRASIIEACDSWTKVKTPIGFLTITKINFRTRTDATIR